MSFNVSIYVPAFNAESAIKKCIESETKWPILTEFNGKI